MRSMLQPDLGRLSVANVDSDNELMEGFQRLVSRKSMPDYFEVIKDPIAFSTIRVRIVEAEIPHLADR